MEQPVNDTKAPSILGANITCGMLAYLAVIVRFICRRTVNINLELDDWLVLAALVAKPGDLQTAR